MKAIWILIVPALASLSFYISSSYKAVNQELHQYTKSTAGDYWNLVIRDTNSSYPRNSHELKLSLGNPEQLFSLTLDTSSSYVSVGKSDCKSCHCIYVRFYQNYSDTFNGTASTKTVSYFLGEATGHQAYDTLRGFATNNYKIEFPSMPFILIDSDTFVGIPSGVIGIGYEKHGDSFIEKLKDQHLIDKKSFSLKLYDPNKKGFNLLEKLDINITSDEYLENGEFDYVKLDNSNGNWELPCDSTYFGGASYYHAKTAKIDLGSSLFIGPKALVVRILETLINDYNCRINSYVVCNCSLIYPSIVLDLDGHKLWINSTDYLYGSDEYCYPILDYDDINFWILGDVFLQHNYLDFNLDKKAIGFWGPNSTNAIENSKKSGNGSDSIITWNEVRYYIIGAISFIILAIIAGMSIFQKDCRSLVCSFFSWLFSLCE